MTRFSGTVLITGASSGIGAACARAFAAAGAFVLALYALTWWTRLAFPLQDFFVLAVLVSFGVFGLAGFNLVFVLEEVVYDAHVRLHVRHQLWQTVPTLVVLALALGLPLWTQRGGPSLPALWTATLVCSVILLCWWFVAVTSNLRGGVVLRELHLLVIGALLASGAADAIAAFLTEASPLTRSITSTPNCTARCALTPGLAC